MRRQREQKNTAAFFVRGLTMVEVLIVVAISTMMMLAIASIVTNFYEYNDYTIAQTSEVANARRGVGIMVRDLREMTFADNGQFPIVATASTSISFFSDIDRDQSVELVAYELQGQTLYKYIYNAVDTVYATTTPDETIILSEYVQNAIEGNPIFTYYDLTGAEATAATSLADLRYAEVDVTVNVDPVRNPGKYTIHTSAAFRNIIEAF